MRTALAEKLLVKIMNWNSEEISQERPLLQALSNLKYDEYQNFSSGSRFIESLARWLDQFQDPTEKRTAYSFIKERLIFISSEQISHLVNLTFTDKINPVLIEKTAAMLNISPYYISRIINSNEYVETLRRSLFIGLSDGARIDQLRRTSELNNEQVLQTYSVSKDKIDEMLEELEKSGYDGKFNSVFLIDDFTASGTSYFRFDKQWKGKIYKTMNSILNPSLNDSKTLSNLFTKLEGVNIHIIFYIATEDAVKNLKDNINNWRNEASLNFSYDIEVIQLINEDVKTEILSEIDFIKMSTRYFDDKIMDVHYKKGIHNHPYLGFNECTLPLVLSHNTPNNSLTLLWLPEDMKYTGLFPRVSRHKE